MIRISEIKLPLAAVPAEESIHPEAALREAAARILKLPTESIARLEVFKRSFDARKAELFAVYIVDIFIRILLTWIPRMPYNRYLRAVVAFVERTTDPYLNLFRRFMPLVRIGPGAIDLSPMIATIVLLVLATVVYNVIHG